MEIKSGNVKVRLLYALPQNFTRGSMVVFSFEKGNILDTLVIKNKRFNFEIFSIQGKRGFELKKNLPGQIVHPNIEQFYLQHNLKFFYRRA